MYGFLKNRVDRQIDAINLKNRVDRQIDAIHPMSEVGHKKTN